jgi:outer membrane protein assembly factor BamE (lipoprotein component of BamABCDE complex)
MRRYAIVAIGLFCVPLTGCLTPTVEYHGYSADEAQPTDIEPGEDTRSSVLAQLGSPSTKSVFDENTWIYTSYRQERFAFFKPKISEQSVIAIVFNEEDTVEEVMKLNKESGEIIQFASRETPTRGRELGLWEQIFGTIGAVRLPNSDEATPGNPTGRRE